MLVDWALDATPGHVLDPSYGTSRFLEAAAAALRTLGVSDPASLLHGFDVDPVATRPGRDRLLVQGASPEQFVHADFLTVTATPRFAAVVGNPPYVRHQFQSDATKARVAVSMEAAGLSISRRASLWAPFVAHASRFVAPGGRLAMVLPGASLQADYAGALWTWLSKQFASVDLIRVNEMVFPDALEESVVLLGSGASEALGTHAPQVHEVGAVSDLRHFLRLSDRPSVLVDRSRLPTTPSGERARDLLNRIAAHDSVVRFGDVAKVRLGVVTGANAFFVRRPSDPLCAALPGRSVETVVPASRALNGTRWTREDALVAASADLPVCLIHLDSAHRQSRAVVAAITRAEAEQIDQRSHCRRRSPWWAIPWTAPPDAFLPYMASRARGLVANTTQAGSINGVHQVNWLSPQDKEGLVASSWTSLWGVALELAARHYAGGVLKLEPGRVKSMPLVQFVGAGASTKIDRALRSGGLDAARTVADQLVLCDELGLSELEVRSLREAEHALSARRSLPRRRSDLSLPRTRT